MKMTTTRQLNRINHEAIFDGRHWSINLPDYGIFVSGLTFKKTAELALSVYSKRFGGRK